MVYVVGVSGLSIFCVQHLVTVFSNHVLVYGQVGGVYDVPVPAGAPGRLLDHLGLKQEVAVAV